MYSIEDLDGIIPPADNSDNDTNSQHWSADSAQSDPVELYTLTDSDDGSSDESWQNFVASQNSSLAVPPDLLQLSNEIMGYLSGPGPAVADFMLLSAATYGYTEIARVCILAGANIHVHHDMEPNVGKTPTEIALANGHKELHHLLITTAVKNTHFTLPPSSPPDGHTNASGTLSQQTLVGAQHQINQGLREYWRYALSRGATTRDERSVWRKIENAIVIWDMQDTHTPINTTVLRKTLIQYIKNTSGNRVYEILHYSILKNSLALCKLAIDAKAPINQSSDFWGGTPLHSAATKGYLDIVKLLILNHANIDTQESDNMDTPLMLAKYQEHSHIIAYLLNNGAKPNLTNEDNESALSIEVFRRKPNTEPVEKNINQYKSALILNKHELETKTNGLKFRPHDTTYKKALDEALNNRNTVKIVLKQLLSQREIGYPITQITDARHAAMEAWKTSRHTYEGVRRLTTLRNEFMAFFTVLLNEGYDLREAMLTEVAAYGHKEFMLLCLSAGANINKPNNNGKTALILVTERGDLASMKMLLEKNADPLVACSLTDLNETPMMIAARNNLPGAVTILSKYDSAFVTQINSNGHTAIEIARQCGHHELAHQLLNLAVELELQHDMPVPQTTSPVQSPLLLSRSRTPSPTTLVGLSVTNGQQKN